jgi:hypothetical protein
LAAQESSYRPFVGSWKGVCADGKEFVIVTFVLSEGGSLQGSIQLANMRGGEDGQCTTVVDPPSPQHAVAIAEAKRNGSTLTFKAKRMEFEMSLPAGGSAGLSFIGTASEQNPWKVTRTK